MQQSKLPFFIIIGLALLVVIAMVAIFFLMPGSVESLVPGQQPVEIDVVVAPAIKPWVDDAAKKYNQKNPNSRVNVIAAQTLIPATQFQTASQKAPPAAWLAEALFVVDMAVSDGYLFDNAQSVAGTSLAWGGYNDKIEQFNQDFGELTWENIHAKASGKEGFKLVMASPQNSAEGLAVLVAAVAAHRNAGGTLTAADVGAADTWLTETLGNNNAQPRSKPAETLASVQGRSIGDAGLLSTASWRGVGLDQSGNFAVLPADPAVVLDYPFAVWAGAQSTPQNQQAATAFRQFLLEDEQQNTLSKYALEPANTNLSGIQVEGQAAQRLLNWANRNHLGF